MNDRIKSYAEFISKQLEREQNILGESKELDKHNKEKKDLFNSIKKDGGTHHGMSHHIGIDFGDHFWNAGHYNNHHVAVSTAHDNILDDNDNPVKKYVHDDVVKQNPHVSAEVHKNFTNDIMNWHKKEISHNKVNEAARERGEVLEAAKEGSVRYSGDGLETRVIHNDGKGNHLHMTGHEEESGAIAFHGKIDGHKIKFDSEGVHGGAPNTKDVKADLKHQHPDLPKEVHDKVHKIAIAGMKKHGYDVPGN